MHRKYRCQKTDFASRLERLGFRQIGDCTFDAKTIKIYRANKSKEANVRYWVVQDLVTMNTIYRSNHTADILEFLEHSTIFVGNAELRLLVNTNNRDG